MIPIHIANPHLLDEEDKDIIKGMTDTGDQTGEVLVLSTMAQLLVDHAISKTDDNKVKEILGEASSVLADIIHGYETEDIDIVMDELIKNYGEPL